MSAPRLGVRLVLERFETTPDGAGGHDGVWVAAGMIWGEMRAGTGREAVQEAVSRAETGWRITVRAVPEGAPSRPGPGMRLRAGARVFAILAVAERDVAGRYLICFAREEEGA